MQVLQWIAENWSGMLNALIAILTGVIGISLMIPGDQPEKALQKIVDFLSNMSRK